MLKADAEKYRADFASTEAMYKKKEQDTYNASFAEGQHLMKKDIAEVIETAETTETEPTKKTKTKKKKKNWNDVLWKGESQ